LLYLALAIGLVLVTPLPHEREAEIIDNFQKQDCNSAEVYFKSAIDIHDSSRKLETKHFWNLQACALMSIYKLATSRRDQADDHMRAAVSMAFSLGLHTDYPEILWNVGQFRDLYSIFQRRNLWRSLFVLDRMVSALMGRPMAIVEEQCSGKVLERLEEEPAANPTPIQYLAMDAAVQTSRLIGRICTKISKVPLLGLETVRTVAEEGAGWQTSLPKDLYWKALLKPNITALDRMTILHVNLLHHYLIVLISRPLFAYVLYEHTRSEGNVPFKVSDRSLLDDAFCKACCKACIDSSVFSVEMIHLAMEGKYLARRNPFVL
jgi:hypothetical protein